jgi:hypothetical protein
MDLAPKVGDRVRFILEKGSIRNRDGWTGYIGTVTKIYKEHDDQIDDDDNVIPGPLLPERRWKVALELDGRRQNLTEISNRSRMVTAWRGNAKTRMLWH